MEAVRWTGREARRADPAAIDALDGVGVLVVEGTDEPLPWFRRAPCVVIARGGDLEVADDRVDDVVAAVCGNPGAARVLVDVVRTVEDLDIERGLVVESLAYTMLLSGPEFATWLGAQRPRDAKRLGPPVRLDRRGTELVVTLSRPENRNAFSAAVRDALVEALWLAEVDATITTVRLRGDGPTFSSGGDLTEFGSSGPGARSHQIRVLRSVGAAIARLDRRVIAEVHGRCVGAGVELAAFTRRVVAAPGTTFRLPEIGMGLIPGAGGTVSLTKRIGRQRTNLLALLGGELDVDTALSWGLVDEIRQPRD